MARHGRRAHHQGRRQKQKTYAPIVVRNLEGKLSVEMGGTRHELALGETSPYVTLEFTPSPALTVQGVTRVTVNSGAPQLDLYLEPISITPTSPYLAVANPLSFGAGLWKRKGRSKRWVDRRHERLRAGALSEAQFVREALATMAVEEKLLHHVLDERAHRVVISVFTSPDRIGHMFYRHLDPKHPGKPKTSVPELVRALDDAYAAMDRIVGGVVQKLGPDDVVLVMSDHGFASFRRGFNMNTWLMQNGFMKLKPASKPARFLPGCRLDADQGLRAWYGQHLSQLQGREAKGSVPAANAPSSPARWPRSW